MSVCMNYKILEYDRIDASEGIDVSKTYTSKESDICHCWCISFHILAKAMNFNDFAIVSVKGSDYRIHLWYMSKNDAVNIMKNSELNEKCGLL